MGGACSKLNHVIEQTYNIREHYLVWGEEGQGRTLREIHFFKVVK